MSRRKEPAIPAELGGLLDSLRRRWPNARSTLGPSPWRKAQAGNSRNGYGRKTVMTDTSKIDIDVPRDRQGSFDPQLIAKYQRRFPGFDEKIISMYVHIFASCAL